MHLGGLFQKRDRSQIFSMTHNVAKLFYPQRCSLLILVKLKDGWNVRLLGSRYHLLLFLLLLGQSLWDPGAQLWDKGKIQIQIQIQIQKEKGLMWYKKYLIKISLKASKNREQNHLQMAGPSKWYFAKGQPIRIIICKRQQQQEHLGDLKILLQISSSECHRYEPINATYTKIKSHCHKYCTQHNRMGWPGQSGMRRGGGGGRGRRPRWQFLYYHWRCSLKTYDLW